MRNTHIVVDARQFGRFLQPLCNCLVISFLNIALKVKMGESCQCEQPHSISNISIECVAYLSNEETVVLPWFFWRQLVDSQEVIERLLHRRSGWSREERCGKSALHPRQHEHLPRTTTT